MVMGTSVAPDCGFDRIDRWCGEAGLSLTEQYATWDRQPFDGGGYRVSVHRPATAQDPDSQSAPVTAPAID
jgi:hypothetical protein